MESEFVNGKVVRLPLSGDGRWVDVKYELSAGETQEMLGQILKETVMGDTPSLSPENVMMAKTLAYLRAWPFTDAQGQPVEISESAIKNLRASTFTEISNAIAAHEASVMAGQKKTSDGAPS